MLLFSVYSVLPILNQVQSMTVLQNLLPDTGINIKVLRNVFKNLFTDKRPNNNRQNNKRQNSKRQNIKRQNDSYQFAKCWK